MKFVLVIVTMATLLSGCSTVEKYNLNPMEWFGSTQE